MVSKRRRREVSELSVPNRPPHVAHVRPSALRWWAHYHDPDVDVVPIRPQPLPEPPPRCLQPLSVSLIDGLAKQKVEQPGGPPPLFEEQQCHWAVVEIPTMPILSSHLGQAELLKSSELDMY
ncbi:hypothetical protein GGTG_02069 [Gaeumannomyces tritici R3-111a-1]|uniref:Uncharacterized protein n=1 Tax=Gaeumannomyces tritici (strain R3-111a-1) TaxID=644352 RepID=J3NLC1_GAET3|nr:hypothetical protein GGTG_02069 [Gaeumannomyces tritici R3-111a-1]EJT82095.1 hypothetical protein GGTG_02069 [Gaeumannomyces tritici R3-111a-1]